MIHPNPNGILFDPESASIPREVRLRVALRRHGVSPSQTERLMAAYDPDRIENQLIWIEYRSSRKRASLLVAAIDQDYEPPANLPEDVLMPHHD